MQQQGTMQPTAATPPPPPPPAAPADRPPDRTYAVLLHNSALSGLVISPIGFLLGPLIMWLLKKDEDAFVNESGRWAVNFQITFLIAYAILFAVAILAFFVTAGTFRFGPGAPDPFAATGTAAGFVLAVLVGMALVVINIVVTVIGALRANEGIVYEYPMAIGFLK
jgi:uncharacterized Tic20 family protein